MSANADGLEALQSLFAGPGRSLVAEHLVAITQDTVRNDLLLGRILLCFVAADELGAVKNSSKHGRVPNQAACGQRREYLPLENQNLFRHVVPLNRVSDKLEGFQTVPGRRKDRSILTTCLSLIETLFYFRDNLFGGLKMHAAYPQ